MLEMVVLMIMLLAVVSGGLIALFAGRKFYPICLGFATYFFTAQVLDLASFSTSDTVRPVGFVIYQNRHFRFLRYISHL